MQTTESIMNRAIAAIQQSNELLLRYEQERELRHQAQQEFANAYGEFADIEIQLEGDAYLDYCELFQARERKAFKDVDAKAFRELSKEVKLYFAL